MSSIAGVRGIWRYSGGLTLLVIGLLLLGGCSLFQSVPSGPKSYTTQNDLIEYTRVVPQQVRVGSVFTVEVTVKAKVELALLAIAEPQVSFSIDPERQKLRFEVNPLFIYGRYRKLVRTIPQTHWPCRACRGRGCPRCGYSGKMYPESVEELIAGPVLAATGGSLARLHGAGREDINARMLGAGRPFVLEIKRPRRRELDLAALELEINATAEGKVQAAQLRTVRHGLVARLKSVRAQKRYRALVSFARPVGPDQLDQALAALVGTIEQRTPQRVSHRRADRLRRRRVLSLEGQLDAASQAVLLIRCEGGLYVKELVSGDEGRTRPSLAGLLGLTAQVLELDVLEVCTDFPLERRSLAQGTEAEVAPGPPAG